jgi:hypothetical protein
VAGFFICRQRRSLKRSKHKGDPSGRPFSHLPHLASQPVYGNFVRCHTLDRGFTGFFFKPITTGVLHEKSNAG